MSERRIKPTKDDYPPPWEDRPVSIERWRKHRGVMLQWAYPGSRPREWWLYEKQMPRPDQEAAALLEMGELSAAELAELMPVWRERYERSWEPGFVYNAGARGWLEGAPARARLGTGCSGFRRPSSGSGTRSGADRRRLFGN